MAKICPECGEVNENIASFCRKCGYDFNTEIDKTTNKFNKNVLLSKSNSSNLKVILCSVAIIVVLSILLISSSGFFDTTQGENITLIKEDAHGNAFMNEGKPIYNYYLEGVFKNLPNNVEGYDLKATFYDENGEYIDQDNGYMDGIKEDSERSEPAILAYMSTSELKNVSYIEVVIIDPNGNTTFNESIDFDMKKMDLSSIKDK